MNHAFEPPQIHTFIANLPLVLMASQGTGNEAAASEIDIAKDVEIDVLSDDSSGADDVQNETQKRQRGRPPKPKPKPKPEPEQELEKEQGPSAGSDSLQFIEKETPKRKRGRPRKIISDDADHVVVKPKRPVGRPRKNPKDLVIHDKIKRPVGRPKKEVVAEKPPV